MMVSDNKSNPRYHRCNVDGCNNGPSSQISCFRFPRDPLRSEQWKIALGFVGDHRYAEFTAEMAYNLLRVCSTHFDAESFSSSGKRLLNTAVPTKRQPKLENDIKYEIPDPLDINLKFEATTQTEYTNFMEASTSTDVIASDQSVQTGCLQEFMEEKASQTAAYLFRNTPREQQLKRKFEEIQKTLRNKRRRIVTTLEDVVEFLDEYYPQTKGSRFPAILNGIESYVNSSTPSPPPQPLPNLLQQKQEAPEETTDEIENMIVNCVSDFEEQDHKKLISEDLHKNEIFLDINLTDYTKEANISGFSEDITFKKETQEPENKEVMVKEEVEDPQDVNCPHCEDSFNTKTALKDHIQNIHPDLFKVFECITCNKRYAKLYNLQMHRKTHFEDEHPHRCDFCESSFEHAIDYKMHLKEEHTIVHYRLCKPYFCENCNEEFDGTKDEFLRHLKVHANAICSVCAEGFPTKQELKVHMEVHPEQYFCSKCDRGFKMKENLRAHEVTHNNPYSCVCPKCKKGFKAKPALKAHIARVHLKKRASYMCEKCSKMCYDFADLARHQRVAHERRKDYKCPHCDKSFVEDSYRKLHIRVMHTGEKPYQCEYCGKRFARSDYVLNHSKIHHKRHKEGSRSTAFSRSLISVSRLRQNSTSKSRSTSVKRPKSTSKPTSTLKSGDKTSPSFHCTVCGKIFSQAVVLKTHLKNVHKIVNRRRFKCRHCDLTFIDASMKLRHEELHNDPANEFQCPVCRVRTENEEELRTHLEGHENPNDLFCAVCEEPFESIPLLVAHVEAEHGEEVESATKSGKVKPHFNCQFCEKSFASMILLCRHLKYAHNVVNTVKFKCRNCDLTFASHEMKMKHEKLHGDPVNRFQCPICQVRMENKKGLKTHLAEHEDPNTFICIDCDKTFPCRVSLDAHINSEHHKKDVEEEKV